MYTCKDDDVKQYYIGQKKEFCESDDDNLEDFVEQKSNGNFIKAKKLGKELGTQILSVDQNSGDMNNQKSIEIDIHRRILFYFAAISSLEILIKNEYVFSVVKKEMDEYIMLRNQDFFNDISSTGAVSFYMLCKRSVKDKKCYGKYFAEMCDKRQDYDFIKLGNMMYIFFFDLAKRIIKKYELN